MALSVARVAAAQPCRHLPSSLWRANRRRLRGSAFGLAYRPPHGGNAGSVHLGRGEGKSSGVKESRDLRQPRIGGGCWIRTVSACAEHLRDHLEGSLDILCIDPVAGDESDVSSAACIRPQPALRALVKEARYRNPVDLEDHEVGLDSPKVELDAFDLSKAFRQRSGVGMVLGQTVHHVIEGI